ncbi:MAG: rod shape-determining protein [Oscillospiraceae bacterium]|nr:rod shape-determining protein [Oscillospiraceae bacterium]
MRLNFFSSDLGIDLGTANILINVDNQGVVIREPSVVAVDKNTGKVLQVGSAARNMLGRTPGNVVAMHPIKDGVISDQEMTVKMLQVLFRSTAKSDFFTPKPRVVISVPSGITEVEERTVINAALEAGARRVYLIEEPMAAALGANLDISGPKGHMVVDIGAGTTDLAVLSMNGVAVSSSIKLAGDAFDEAIARYVRWKHNVLIGQITAEDIKIQIGSVYPRQETSMQVRGRDVNNGMPREILLTSVEISQVLVRLAKQIADEILALLEVASPELVGDIAQTGITLTGGGSLLSGMEQFLTENTGTKCTIADDPESCVAYGCGKSLSWINTMNEGPINIARKRLMRQN